jgi:hypothetical protein
VDDEDLDCVYDTILCLSVTKWVHFNHGDPGVKLLFSKVRHCECVWGGGWVWGGVRKGVWVVGWAGGWVGRCVCVCVCVCVCARARLCVLPLE